MHESEPSPPNQPEHITSEQIPHSGVHHDEHPVDEFDNTPLPEAVERGLVNPTPDTPAELAPTDPTDKKSRKKLVIGGVAFLAGAAVIAGSVIGVKAAGDAPKNAAPAPDPKATSQTPEATPTAAVEAIDPRQFDMPLNATPEELGQKYAELSTATYAGDLTPAVYEAFINDNSGITSQEYAQKVATKNVTALFDAQYIPNWRDDPNLAGAFRFATDANAARVFNYRGPGTLTDSFTLVDAKVLSDDGQRLILAVSLVEHYQGIPNDQDTAKINGYESHEQITLVRAADRFLISNWLPTPTS